MVGWLVLCVTRGTVSLTGMVKCRGLPCRRRVTTGALTGVVSCRRISGMARDAIRQPLVRLGSPTPARRGVAGGALVAGMVCWSIALVA